MAMFGATWHEDDWGKGTIAREHQAKVSKLLAEQNTLILEKRDKLYFLASLINRKGIPNYILLYKMGITNTPRQQAKEINKTDKLIKQCVRLLKQNNIQVPA